MFRKSYIAVALILATPAMAVLTQPIADEATIAEGTMRLSGGITLESDFNMFGVRGTYGLMDGLSTFIGAGLADPDGLDSAIYLQAGGLYTLPVDLPVDLALRGALGFASFSSGGVDLDVLSLNIGLLASKPIHQMITAYGFGGLSMARTKISARGFGSRSDTDTEPALAAGAIYHLDQNISLYGEIAHIDELFISLGARYTF